MLQRGLSHTWKGACRATAAVAAATRNPSPIVFDFLCLWLKLGRDQQQGLGTGRNKRGPLLSQAEASIPSNCPRMSLWAGTLNATASSWCGSPCPPAQGWPVGVQWGEQIAGPRNTTSSTLLQGEASLSQPTISFCFSHLIHPAPLPAPRGAPGSGQTGGWCWWSRQCSLPQRRQGAEEMEGEGLAPRWEAADLREGEGLRCTKVVAGLLKLAGSVSKDSTTFCCHCCFLKNKAFIY